MKTRKDKSERNFIYFRLICVYIFYCSFLEGEWFSSSCLWFWWNFSKNCFISLNCCWEKKDLMSLIESILLEFWAGLLRIVRIRRCGRVWGLPRVFFEGVSGCLRFFSQLYWVLGEVQFFLYKSQFWGGKGQESSYSLVPPSSDVLWNGPCFTLETAFCQT